VHLGKARQEIHTNGQKENREGSGFERRRASDMDEKDGVMRSNTAAHATVDKWPCGELRDWFPRELCEVCSIPGFVARCCRVVPERFA